MNNELVSAILLGIIPLTSGIVSVYWHLATRGTWRNWPAGRSLMALLLIITAGFTYGVINRFLGAYPARYAIAVGLYALFVGAIIFIGLTIRKEMRLGKQRLTSKSPPHTGPVTVTVASTNEEKTND